MATTNRKKPSSTTKKKTTAPKKPTKKAQEQFEMERMRKRRELIRITSIITFTLSVFVFFVAIIEGAGVWNWLHNAYVGVFGFGAYLLPFLTIGVSVLFNMEKKDFSIAVKAIETFVLIVFVCSLIHIIRHQVGASYWNTLVTAYKTATETINGGFLGASVGELLLSFGKAGAIVTNILVIFVVLMLITGATLIEFFKTAWKPVQKTSEQIAPIIEQKMEVRRNRKAVVDIPLGPDELQKKTKAQKKNETKLGFADPEFAPKRVDEQKPKETIADVSDIERLFHPSNVDDEETVVADSPIDDIIKKAVATDSVVTGAKTSAKPKLKPAQDKPVDTVPVENMEIPKESIETQIKNYQFPPVDILKQARYAEAGDVSNELKANAEKLVETLASFGVETKITDIFRGPTVTRYELKPSVGVKISKITNLSDDIALNLAASGVRIEAPIPNKAAVGIEVPNKIKNAVSMREIIDTNEFRSTKSKLTAGLGKDITGNCIYCDIAKMPHLLIAGATGAGKSVCMNSIIISILYKAKPDEVKFLMIDPKKVEFAMYSGIPHLLVPVVTDPRKAAGALGWAVSEMLQRYKMFVDRGVKDINGYNRMAEQVEEMTYMPQIVIFIDELSDLMMAAPNEVEDSICRLAQMARAAGMHLVIATQRPSVDVITGIIKANIPSRIALTVSSQIDSRTILDTAGAEKLLGRGDMLYSPVGLGKPTRVQGCFVTEEEIEELISFIKEQGNCAYDENISKEIEEKAVKEKKKGSAFDTTEEGDDSDPLFAEAVEVVLQIGSASTSVLQRKLKVGYARGARIVDQLEERGIVGPPEGSKPRKVLINKQQWLEMCANTPAQEQVEQISFDEKIEEENFED